VPVTYKYKNHKFTSAEPLSGEDLDFLYNNIDAEKPHVERPAETPPPSDEADTGADTGDETPEAPSPSPAKYVPGTTAPLPSTSSIVGQALARHFGAPLSAANEAARAGLTRMWEARPRPGGGYSQWLTTPYNLGLGALQAASAPIVGLGEAFDQPSQALGTPEDVRTPGGAARHALRNAVELTAGSTVLGELPRLRRGGDPLRFPAEPSPPPEPPGPRPMLALPPGPEPITRTSVATVRRGDRRTQDLLEAARASQSTPPTEPIPEVPPGTRRMLEGQPRVSRPPISLVEPEAPPLPIPGTRGPSAGELPALPRHGEAGPPVLRPAEPALQRDIPGERQNPREYGGTQATLGAARDLETGRQLDLGEVGRRRAAERGRAPTEALPIPGRETPAPPRFDVVTRTDTWTPESRVVYNVPEVRSHQLETVPRAAPPPPGEAGAPPPGSPPPPTEPPRAGGPSPEEPAGGRAPRQASQNYPDDPQVRDARLAEIKQSILDQTKDMSWRERLRAWRLQLAPERTLAILRSGNPYARAYIDTVTPNEANWNRFIKTNMEDARPAFANIRTADDKAQLALLLDSHVTPAQLSRQPLHIQETYNFMRDRYSALADRLGLPPSARIADYFPHIFNTEDVRSMLEREYAAFAAAGASERATEIERILKTLGQPNIGPASRVPDSVYAWMTQKRSGAGGYQWDPIDAYRAYVRRAADKLYVEPVLQSFYENQAHITTDPALRRVMARHAADFGGRGSYSPVLEKLDQGLRGGQYWMKLAGNITYPLFNFTAGQLMRIAHFTAQGDIGALSRGMGWLNTPEGRALFADSGETGIGAYHNMSGRNTLPGMGQRNPTAESIEQAAFLFPERVEWLNRGSTFLGQLWHDLGPQLGQAGFRKMLMQGYENIPLDARINAHRAITETQGSYGVRHDPEWLKMPGLRAAFQFSATPAKILQGGVAKQGASQLSRPIIPFAVYSTLVNEGLRQVGWDASRWAGIGVNLTGLIKDVYQNHMRPPDQQKSGSDIAKDNIIDPWLEGRSGIFSIGTGPSISTTTRLPAMAKAATAVAPSLIGNPVRPGSWSEVGRVVSPEIVALNRGQRSYGASDWSSPGETAGLLAANQTLRHAALARVMSMAERGTPGARQEYADFIAANGYLSPTEEAALARRFAQSAELRAQRRAWDRAHGETAEEKRQGRRPSLYRSQFER
jgi:hypothetical protein